MTPPSITVITLSRNRVTLLSRAIASVQAQDFTGRFEHLIVIDGCHDTRRFLERLPRPSRPLLRWQFVPRDPDTPGGAPRCAVLRNLAIDMAWGERIAMLDDDNRFAAHHLSSLWHLACDSGAKAVHSYRFLFWRNGKAFRLPVVPWIPDPDLSRHWHAKLVDRAVLRLGDNLMCDCADPFGHPDPVRTIDTSEWLLDASLLREVRFRTEYDAAEISSPAGMVCEDGKLLDDLARRRVRVETTGLPTLDYFLGGYSAPAYLRPGTVTVS